MTELTPVLKAAISFAYIGGGLFVFLGIILSTKLGRIHPILLVCISAASFSWIEAPYDWAVYAQFPPAIPRMPEWWPLNMTWGGLPAAVPPGYIAYFVLPAIIGAYLGPKISESLQSRLSLTLLVTGLCVGFVWAFLFNALLGAQLGVFYYGRVIEGLALWEGTKHQYPIYDAVAMGVQMMVFTYILGRTDDKGRTFVQVWSDNKTQSKAASGMLSILAIVAIGHLVYLSVFAPHIITKVLGLVTVGPTEQLFDGVPNQPL